MLKLEEIQKNAAISGIVPGQVVRVVTTEPAGDYDSMSRLKDQVRSLLAWQSIVSDYKENKIVLDNLMAKNADGSMAQARDALQRMIRESYKWLLTPVQEVRPGKGLGEIEWEHFPLNPGASDFGKEIVRVLKDNELLIDAWSPSFLRDVLKTWFWKDGAQEVGALDVWHKFCQYLYLPRLKNDDVYRTTLHAGANVRDFFGIAYGKEDGKYIGFSYGHIITPILDAALLLIEPTTAAAYDAALRTAAEAAKSTTASEPAKPDSGGTPPDPIKGKTGFTYKPGETETKQTIKRQFYGSIDLDPIQAKKQFADLVDEIIIPFTSRPGVKVKIAIEIEAETQSSFDDTLQRVIKENSAVLHFKKAEFEG